jgi:inosine-uridine nucleoside N-ribohydrolase
MTIKIVLDCDTGTDDAIAIMLAALHPQIELLAITTVNGNVPLPNATENTLRILDRIGAHVPVYAGAARPFARPDFPVPREVLNAGNPEFQLAYLELPEAVTSAQSKSAVQHLVDTFMDPAHDDVVLVATGPLTNVALALAAEPRLASRIHSVVMMGGAHVGGNVTATAEFNFWVDPEAARAVFNAGLREVVVVPLDATHSAPLTLEDCDTFDALGTPAGSTAAALIRHRVSQDQTRDTSKEEGSAPVHDPLCVAYLIRPDVITRSGRWPVTVETAGEGTIGQMVVDTRPWAPDPANATVALEASAAVFRDLLVEGFSIDIRRDARRRSGRPC